MKNVRNEAIVSSFWGPFLAMLQPEPKTNFKSLFLSLIHQELNAHASQIAAGNSLDFQSVSWEEGALFPVCLGSGKKEYPASRKEAVFLRTWRHCLGLHVCVLGIHESGWRQTVFEGKEHWINRNGKLTEQKAGLCYPTALIKDCTSAGDHKKQSFLRIIHRELTPLNQETMVPR